MSSSNQKDKIVGSKHIQLSLIVGGLKPFVFKTATSSDRNSKSDTIPIHALGDPNAIAQVSGNIEHKGGFSLQKGEYDNLILYIKSIDFSFNTLLNLSEIEVSLISFDSLQSITTVFQSIVFSDESYSSERNTHETIVDISFSITGINVFFPT